MRSIHLVISDLFLPQHVASEACSGLALPALQALLARAHTSHLSLLSLEAWLCDIFCVKPQSIAPITLLADGLEPGTSYWLRADPVHLRLQRDQLILQTDVSLTVDESAQLCASLNTHFAADGWRFVAPHPQRWYLKLDAAPDMSTHHLSQVVGKDVHGYLPQGGDSLRWHGMLNEIQMLLFGHELNQAREARGELPINSVWLWGGGQGAGELTKAYTRVLSDSVLANAFAQVADIQYDSFSNDISQDIEDKTEGEVLVVWEGLRHALQQGDLKAWREGVLRFEDCCAKSLLDALRAGRIDRLVLDVLQAGASRRFVITRVAAWKLWKRSKPLAGYAV